MRPNSHSNHRPHGYWLTLIALLAVGGLALEHDLHLTPVGHKLLLLAIVAVAYSLLGAWVKVNGAALEDLSAGQGQAHRSDSAPYGPRELPTHTPARLREALPLQRHEIPGK